MSNRVPKLIKFPADLIKEIEQYKQEHYHTSFTAALFELIRKGLRR
ncbi:hypothetical protein Q5W88_21595 [Shouchella clausii]|nr:hypothetical protein [Shouchella clausii]MDO7285901.1 hypothetical protein [Shouchella clausii]MDO7305804.1 hypothetical protein [Shouchella clausii]